MRIPGRSWWPEEVPGDEEYDETWSNLAAHGNRVDVIISHAAPEETMQMFVQIGEISHRFLQEGSSLIVMCLFLHRCMNPLESFL